MTPQGKCVMKIVEMVALGFLLCISTIILFLFRYVVSQCSLTGIDVYGFQAFALLAGFGGPYIFGCQATITGPRWSSYGDI